jgi:hypothetical protein
MNDGGNYPPGQGLRRLDRPALRWLPSPGGAKRWRVTAPT